ncbi:hypothetical protein SERLA73DRAFT_171438 [Serpula lacrymans var. lacrymans S7.3]|uniref:WH1 domain-containing protein n=1 Tax=Serpula lacrymans var. lacrymans (strain S7.3) TaxID=936435 RepID=F8QB50_SERL3|nr:hypothetical protein SERLA73DRAFT_171438 [Serpula lacrymans var. lacrymans S7.3]
MPVQSSISADEKARIKSALPSSSNKIMTATPARVYFAHPQPSKWSYGGIEGALAFVRDTTKDAFFLKVVDLNGSRGVIWEHELYDGFDYFQDRPFFHSFAGDECMIGLIFANEKEAKTLFKKVTTRKEEKVAKVGGSEKKKKSAKGGKIDKSMISGPTTGSFVHVAHMGYDDEKGFTSNNVDPSWTTLVGNLEDIGVPREYINNDRQFIERFMSEDKNRELAAAEKAAKKPPAPPAPRRVQHGQQDSVASIHTDTAPTPPPPPPSRPPPPPSRPAAAPPAPPTQAPPPPPQRHPRAPPTPSRGGPPPPPTRPMSTAPPPPPQPPARPVAAPPPPPPARPGANGGATSAILPPPQPGRSDLLASIRGQSVSNLRKTPAAGSTPSPPPIAEEPSGASGGGGGGDLTAALAAALMERNKKLGDSDEEDEEDDWD